MSRSLLDQAHEMADRLTEAWHRGEGPNGLMLHEYLGMSREEYSDFVQGTGEWARREEPAPRTLEGYVLTRMVMATPNIRLEAGAPVEVTRVPMKAGVPYTVLWRGPEGEVTEFDVPRDGIALAGRWAAQHRGAPRR